MDVDLLLDDDGNIFQWTVVVRNTFIKIENIIPNKKSDQMHAKRIAALL